METVEQALQALAGAAPYGFPLVSAPQAAAEARLLEQAAAHQAEVAALRAENQRLREARPRTTSHPPLEGHDILSRPFCSG